MFKYLKNNPALTLYLLVNLIYWLAIAIVLGYDIFTMETYKCYVDMGSFRETACSLKVYLFDHLFYATFGWLIFQKALIPAGLFTYLIIKVLKEKYSSIRSRLGMTYFIALILFILIGYLFAVLPV